MLEFLRELLGHSEWADAAFFQAWGASPARENEELRRRVDHIITVQRAFLSILGGGQPLWPSDGPPPGFEELKTRSEEAHRGLRTFAAGLDPEAIARTVRLPWFPEPPCVLTVAEGLVQVALHTQHHRGQCMTRLKDFGGAPVNVDWVIWIWQGKPTNASQGSA
ncbi:MAG TPA: DinB family protein [Isosphaeraceae bacterium]|jgi:uncharacterized damage-inducible protein DinB|nr:DinB family protein [Isosphaeraceae bacterium]